FADLDKLLFIYEAWGHQLYPKINFDAMVDRLEALGNKREVHTVMNRFRVGISDLLGAVKSDDVVEQFDSPHEETDQENQEPILADAFPDSDEEREMAAQFDAKWQNLIDEQQQYQGGSRVAGMPEEIEEEMVAGPSKVTLPDGVSSAMQEEDRRAMSQIVSNNDNLDSVQPLSDVTEAINTSLHGLTGEERAARSRFLALERMRAKKSVIGAEKSSSKQSLDCNSFKMALNSSFSNN
ncbi:hypothetical protein Ciccas_011145, partial [Cichlidogyrus casuarinus]